MVWREDVIWVVCSVFVFIILFYLFYFSLFLCVESVVYRK